VAADDNLPLDVTIVARALAALLPLWKRATCGAVRNQRMAITSRQHRAKKSGSALTCAAGNLDIVKDRLLFIALSRIVWHRVRLLAPLYRRCYRHFLR